MRDGIHVHPRWYPGLSASSSFSDFQAQVHKASPNVCPVPCGSAASASPSPAAPATTAAPAAAIPGCRDVKAGESCYSAVRWAMLHGIREHPHWYPGLTASSSWIAFYAWRISGGFGLPFGPTNACWQPTQLCGYCCWGRADPEQKPWPRKLPITLNQATCLAARRPQPYNMASPQPSRRNLYQRDRPQGLWARRCGQHF
eukprot:g12447.t1